ncbi:hypothetical protein U1Q18_021236 [Sarracenia purpurea var. burkii]
MEEEISTALNRRKRLVDGEVESVHSNSGPLGFLPVKKNDRTCQRRHHQMSYSSSGKVSSDKLNLAAILKAFRNQIGRGNEKHHYEVQKSTTFKCDQANKINPGWVQKSEDAEKCIDLVFGQYLSKERESYRSPRFLDVLKILNSNKELFLKLLQDPNSFLAKHIQKLRDLQEEKEVFKLVPESKFGEGGIRTRHCDEATSNMKCQKQNMYNFLRSKFRSPYAYISSRVENPQIPSEIVGLKPGVRMMEISENITCHCSFMHSHRNIKNKRKSMKASYFSFKGVRRKLKCARGDDQKEQHWIATNGNLDQFPHDQQIKGGGGEGIGGKIATRNFESSGDTKIRDKLDQPRDPRSAIKGLYKDLSLSNVNCSRGSDLEIYQEANRHLSERLNNTTHNESSSGKEAPRTLGRILSLPQHDFLVTRSPEQVTEHSQLRFFPYRNLQMASDTSCRLQKENKSRFPSSLWQSIEASPCADNRESNDTLQIFHSKPDMFEILLSDNSDGYMKIAEINDVMQPGEFNILEVRSTSSNTCIASVKQSTNTANICEEVEYFECSRPDSPSENQVLTSSLEDSSPSPSSIQELKVGDSINDRTEHRSPVSVLESFFIEHVTSPPKTITNPANSTMQPLPIEVEEHNPVVSSGDPKMDLETGMNYHELASMSDEVFLQAACLPWDRLLLKGQPSDQLLLSPPLLDETEFPPINSSIDHRLLFDFLREVVSEVYTCYFGCSPWLSFLRPKIYPVPGNTMAVHEIKKRVDQYLLPLMVPTSLEQLVGEDVVSSETWMDIRHDSEDIVIQMVEFSVEELLAETIYEIQI